MLGRKMEKGERVNREGNEKINGVQESTRRKKKSNGGMCFDIGQTWVVKGRQVPEGSENKGERSKRKLR